MKKLKLFFILILSVCLFSCSDDKENCCEELLQTESFELSEGCNWQKLEKNKLYRINNLKDLTAITDCQAETQLPKVDFDSHTLLVVSGVSPYGISEENGKHKIDNTLSTGNKFVFTVQLHNTLAAVLDEWTVAVIAPKIPNSKPIELVIKNQNGVLK